MAKTGSIRERRAVRLWPAFVIAALAVVAVVVIQAGDSTGQNKYTRSVLILVAASGLLVLWWTFISRIGMRVRLTGLGVVLVLVAATSQLVRFRGVTGDLEPLLRWRWSAVPDTTLPTENLDYSEFSDALGALSHYADDTYLEILNLGQSPNAASRYDPKEDDLDWGDN